MSLRQQMIDDLQLAGLSERTQEAYVRAMRQFTDYYGQAPDQLTEQQLRDYFLYLKNEKRFAPGSLATIGRATINVSARGLLFPKINATATDKDATNTGKIPSQPIIRSIHWL